MSFLLGLGSDLPLGWRDWDWSCISMSFHFDFNVAVDVVDDGANGGGVGGALVG